MGVYSELVFYDVPQLISSISERFELINRILATVRANDLLEPFDLLCVLEA